MFIAGLALAGVAALVHVFIFYLESIAWMGKQARRTFGTGSVEEAEAQKELAFNQGFYSLFLVIAVALGISLFAAGQQAVGATLVFTGAGFMAAASLVLLLSSPDKASAALKQGVIPALGVLLLVLGLALCRRSMTSAAGNRSHERTHGRRLCRPPCEHSLGLADIGVVVVSSPPRQV